MGGESRKRRGNEHGHMGVLWGAIVVSVVAIELYPPVDPEVFIGYRRGVRTSAGPSG